MKKHMKVLSGLVTSLLVVGLAVSVFNFTSFATGMGGFHNGMMGGYNNGMMSGYGNGTDNGYNGGMMNGYNGGMMNGYNNGMMNGYNNGMMGNYSNDMMGTYGTTQLQDYDVSKLIPLDELTEKVEKYISNYNEELKIEDIFVFSNSEYYYSIIEEDTGNGAMELLVNPITGAIYPEHGPNMMWNEKYGMHGSSGMMGMMGGSFFNNTNDGQDKLSTDSALEKANQYLASINADFEAEAGGHAFDGYYTFHVEKGGEAEGMLSVNSYTGDVWYHNWHGNLLEIKSTDH